jgi:hypothetical protein
VAFHTSHDGDVLFTVTTNEIEHADLGLVGLGMLGCKLAWDAVLASTPGA